MEPLCESLDNVESVAAVQDMSKCTHATNGQNDASKSEGNVISGDDIAIMTNYLRGRLMSERSASKVSKEQAYQLEKKVKELEQMLLDEVEMCRKFEEAAHIVLEKIGSMAWKAEGIQLEDPPQIPLEQFNTNTELESQKIQNPAQQEAQQEAFKGPAGEVNIPVQPNIVKDSAILDPLASDVECSSGKSKIANDEGMLNQENIKENTPADRQESQPSYRGNVQESIFQSSMLVGGHEHMPPQSYLSRTPHTCSSCLAQAEIMHCAGLCHDSLDVHVLESQRKTQAAFSIAEESSGYRQQHTLHAKMLERHYQEVPKVSGLERGFYSNMAPTTRVEFHERITLPHTNDLLCEQRYDDRQMAQQCRSRPMISDAHGGRQRIETYSSMYPRAILQGYNSEAINSCDQYYSFRHSSPSLFPRYDSDILVNPPYGQVLPYHPSGRTENLNSMLMTRQRIGIPQSSKADPLYRGASTTPRDEYFNSYGATQNNTNDAAEEVLEAISITKQRIIASHNTKNMFLSNRR